MVAGIPYGSLELPKRTCRLSHVQQQWPVLQDQIMMVWLPHHFESNLTPGWRILTLRTAMEVKPTRSSATTEGPRDHGIQITQTKGRFFLEGGSQKRLKRSVWRFGSDSCGPKETFITWGHGRMNPFASARGNKTAMRPFVKILWHLSVPIKTVLLIFGHNLAKCRPILPIFKILSLLDSRGKCSHYNFDFLAAECASVAPVFWSLGQFWGFSPLRGNTMQDGNKIWRVKVDDDLLIHANFTPLLQGWGMGSKN